MKRMRMRDRISQRAAQAAPLVQRIEADAAAAVESEDAHRARLAAMPLAELLTRRPSLDIGAFAAAHGLVPIYGSGGEAGYVPAWAVDAARERGEIGPGMDWPDEPLSVTRRSIFDPAPEGERLRQLQSPAAVGPIPPESGLSEALHRAGDLPR
jgi:hypothetical protein